MIRAIAIVLALIVMPAAIVGSASAESENPLSQQVKKKKSKTVSDDGEPATTNWNNPETAGPSTTETQVVDDGTVMPFLSANSDAMMDATENRYATIVANGGWPKVPSGKFNKGSQGAAIKALNKRLFLEGYLRPEGVEGDYAQTYTSATAEGVKRFQRNHGLKVTGNVDTATLAELNVSAERRFATIRSNIPRILEYSKDLGGRYVVVNVPAMQIMAVTDGRVFSAHNAIVGRPSRPTPVVMTNLSTVKFNPYWNAPASIVERDILPKMLSNGPSKVLREMNIKVFEGVGGPEIDPDKVNWRRVVVDNYHFRQEPGGENAMKTAKIEFNSPFGIYLHDTPEPQLFKNAQRFYSSGCVRVDKVEILLDWILRGQEGLDRSRIAELAETKERLDVSLVDPPQLRVAYLTAWPVGNGIAAFRPDVYEMDNSGFVVGQPLPVGETEAGLRYVLKPVARTAAAVEAEEASGFFGFKLFRSRNPDKNLDTASYDSEDDGFFSSKKKKKKDEKSASTDTKSKKAKKSKKPVEEVASTDTKKTTKKKKIEETTTKKPDDTKVASAPEETKTESKTETAEKPKPAATSTECKPGADGKLPAGCPTPVEASVSKKRVIE